MKCILCAHIRNTLGRAPQGARGLKLRQAFRKSAECRRAPQGARGLKFIDGGDVHTCGNVAPRKGRVG